MVMMTRQKIQNYRIKAIIKRKALDTQEGIQSMITSSINQLNEEAAVHLPKIDTLKRTIVISHKKSYNVPPEPTSLTSLELSEFYTITDKATVRGKLVLAPPPASDITPARILSLLSLFPLLHLHFKVRPLTVRCQFSSRINYLHTLKY